MPAYAPQRFHWIWNLRATPAALWPLVSNTDRFNRDCGYPPVEVVTPPRNAGTAAPLARRLRARVGGLVVEWEEQAFEWTEPFRYSVDRTYFSGPVARMLMGCELTPRGDGGTTLAYYMDLTPASLLGRFVLPFAIGRRARAVTERVFRRYDATALAGARVSPITQAPQLATGGAARLASLRRNLAAGQPALAPASEQLATFIATADDLSAHRMRPYVLAAHWRTDRRATLELFLHATRAGLLDFRWDLVCPHCRGAKGSQSSLAKIDPTAHCDTCHVDFTANFDQSLELTFTPNPSIRPVPRLDYCVGGPQITPHVVAQRLVPAGQSATLRLAVPPGRYRVRSPGLAEQHAFRLDDAPGGARAALIELSAKSLHEPAFATDGELTLGNLPRLPSTLRRRARSKPRVKDLRRRSFFAER